MEFSLEKSSSDMTVIEKDFYLAGEPSDLNRVVRKAGHVDINCQLFSEEIFLSSKSLV